VVYDNLVHGHAEAIHEAMLVQADVADGQTLRTALRDDQVAAIAARRLEIPLIGVSSTDIRRRVREGRSIRYLVPEDVRRYVLEKGLYRE